MSPHRHPRFDFLDNPRVMKIARGSFVVLVVIGVLLNAVAIRVAQDAANDQREGRRIAVETTCAAISAVVDAGRASLRAGGKAQAQPFERNLLKLGYPKLKERRAGAELAAATYARSISSEVARVTGRKDLVNRDGSLNCGRLQREAAT